MKKRTLSNGGMWFAFLIAISILGRMSAAAAPSEKEQALEADLRNLQTAAGVFDAQFVDLPLDTPLVSCELFAEGYKGGAVTNIFERMSIGSNPPAKEEKSVKICVCVTPVKPREWDFSKRIRGDFPPVPGTGSMRLGVAIQTMDKRGGFGATGSSREVPNVAFDFYELRGMKCQDLPFTVLDSHHEDAKPVVIYLPRKFDPKSLKGEVNATSLPDGTIVVYAVIKTSI